MAKWKWREEKKTAGTGHAVEVADYGWYCADCGTDMDKYLRDSGYVHPIGMIHMKRKTPKFDYCPACGVRKTKEEDDK